jgi:hypothetical protein
MVLVLVLALSTEYRTDFDDDIYEIGRSQRIPTESCSIAYGPSSIKITCMGETGRKSNKERDA